MSKVSELHKLRRFCGAMLGVLSGMAYAQFIPNEDLVSANPGLIDFEFSASRARVAWTDPNGQLWLARVNRATGAFEPVTGRGVPVASNTVAKSNMFKWNGPEWLSMASGDQISFSQYLPGKPKTAENTRMALAVMNSEGAWVVQPLSPELPRMAHVTSRDPGDTNPRVRYLDPELNHYWRNVRDPASEEKLAFLPPSNRAWRFASGIRGLLYTAPVSGTSQVFSYMLDNRSTKQLTFDAGNKDTGRSVPWMWQAPEFGNDYVVSSVINENELRVYRKLTADNGVSSWTRIYSATVPGGRTIGSPEWFTYNGKSYLLMAVFLPGSTYPSEVWVSGIEANNPVMRKITPDAPFRVRNDPEVFVTDQGPYVYYNRYDPAIDPEHPLCNECSEGVFKADTGLFGR